MKHFFLLISLWGGLTCAILAQKSTKDSANVPKDTLNKLVNNTPNPYVPKNLPPAPNAASLGKYGETPVSYYTGLPNTNIPLYTIEDGDLKVPISLSYHHSGIKVEEEASNVGLGWALGVISRNTRDKDDLIHAYGRAFKQLSTNPDSDPNYYTSTSVDNSDTDSELDIFYYNVGGKSGSFILDSQNRTSFPANGIEGIPLDKSNVKIRVYEDAYVVNGYRRHHWVITTEDGFIYTFAQQEISASASGSASTPQQYENLLTEYSATALNFSYRNTNITTAWYLSKIESPNTGKTITFNYEDQCYYSISKPFFSEFYNRSNIYTSGTGSGTFIMGLASANDLPSGFSYSVSATKNVYLKSIQWTNGQVEFALADREDYSPYHFTTTSNYPFSGIFPWGTLADDLTNTSCPSLKKPQKVTGILLKNKNLNLVKQWSFQQSYFNQAYVDSLGTINSSGKMVKKYASLRLRLDALMELDPNGQQEHNPYSFTYIGDNLTTATKAKLPTKTSWAKDYFGYYNGKDANNNSDYAHVIGNFNVPKLIGVEDATDPLGVNFQLIGVANTANASSGLTANDGVDREPNEIAKQKGTLASITYPTTGTTTFEYESPVALTGEGEVEEKYITTSQTLDLSNAIVTLNYGLSCSQTPYTVSNGRYAHGDCPGTLENPNLLTTAQRQQVYLRIDKGASTFLQRTYNDWFLSNNYTCTTCDTLRKSNFTTTDNTSFTFNFYTPIASPHPYVRLWIYHQRPYRYGMVAGLRIKSINLTDPISATNKKQSFSYLMADGNTPSGKQMTLLTKFVAGYKEILYRIKTCQPVANIDDPIHSKWWGIYAYANSSTPLGSSAGGNHVGYDRVIVQEQDVNLNTNGKSVYEYVNIANTALPTNLFPNLPTKANLTNGMLLREAHFNASGAILKESIYVPALLNSTTYSGMQWLPTGVCSSTSTAYAPIIKQYYEIPSGFVYNQQTTERQYIGTNLVETVTTYQYNNPTYLFLTSSSTTDSKGQTILTNFTYPHDYTVEPYLTMKAKNILSPVIEKTIFQNGTQATWTNTNYATFGAFQLPERINTKIGAGTIQTPIIFNNYDARGNLSSYTLQNGQKASFTYFSTTDLGKTDLVKSYTLAGGTAGTALARTINYEYIPLVGLSSTTDINGYTTTYNYDNFNRLASTKDAQGYLLAENFYHYANQTALSGLGISPDNASNYVVTRSAREAQTGTALDSDVTKTSTQVQYLDGLGRPLQTQLWKATPDQTKDLITATSLYDAFGRDYKHILPTPSNTNTGAFNNTAEGLAQAFYGDNAPSTETVFEASPLNRPFKQFGAGQAWRTANKFTQFDYWITGSEVVRFDIQANGSVTGTTYPSSSLYNNVVTSERGIWTLEVKDKQGRVVSKWQQLEVGTLNFATTDYVYNDLGQLSYVIPPNIDALFQAGTVSSFTESDNVFLEGIYGYHYDNKGRLIEKHIPGAGWTRYVYDKNDRVVLENDDKDAAASTNYYKFTLYDALGRSIMGGTINNIGTFSRTQLQSDFDAVSTPYEERGTGLLGYTNRSFPSGYQPIDANVKSVTYYDDYTWQTETAYNFQPANAFHTQGLTKGVVTGTLTRNLETNTWQKNVAYYDYKGRVIQDFHLTNRGNLIRKDYQYRFNGELLKTRITKGTSVKILTYEYDHVGRKTKFKHSLNGNEKTISKYVYDGIGRLKSKQFSPTSAIASLQTGNWTTTSTWQGGLLPTLSDNVSINAGHTITIPTGQTATAGSLYNAGTLQNYGTLSLGSLSGNATAGTLQTLDYKYHIRGGLLGINLDANNYLTNSIFSYKLAYEDDGTYYDGNIRNQYWKSTVDGIQRAYQYEYDGASRLTSAIYASTKSGETFALNSVSYDNNGNIKTLSRNGATNAAFTSFGNVDNLVYTYQNNSNKLQKVQDGISGNTDLGDFRDGTNTDNDYEYWEDGSLKRDKNKAITITYNYLKLPKIITFDNTRTITTEYDAAGTKLKKIDSNGEITEYEEDEIYVNGNLYQISHDEGRIANGIYEYNITDHNNDLRIAIKDSAGLAVPTQSIFYDPWGLSMKGMQITRNASNYNKYQFLNRETQVETGYIDLVHRQYDPSIARFTSQDPIIEGQEHLSLYQYGWNNPILKPDPNGECPLCDVVNFAKGFNAAFVEDVFPIPVNLVNHGKGGSYGKGATAGHIVAALVGVGEVITGAGGEAGSAVVTVLSGGTAAPVAVPVALGSAVAIRHGVNTIDRATKSLKTANSKEEGSYTNTHESGKRYHGKGDKDRASESGEEKAKKYNDPLKSTDWTPASNTREAFKQESRRLDTDKVGNQAGHKNPNNYNKRNSPGAKYRKQDGDI